MSARTRRSSWLQMLRQSILGIAAIMLQDQGGGLQRVSYWPRKLNLIERGNTYSA
jgi:hypothetical protein